MMYLTPFRAEHVKAMRVQVDQEQLLTFATLEGMKTLEGPYAVTLMRDGQPVACAGALPLAEHRCHVWAILGAVVDANLFRAVHNFTKTFLAGLPFRRVEVAVACGFEAGHRWVRALGFTCETLPMRSYLIDGTDCLGYAIVREA